MSEQKHLTPQEHIQCAEQILEDISIRRIIGGPPPPPDWLAAMAALAQAHLMAASLASLPRSAE